MRKKVVFFGSHEMALPLLNFLHSSDIVALVAIVSQPARPSGRGQRVVETAVSEFAIANSIPLATPQKPDGDTVAWIKNIGCDLILVMAYGHILRRDILAVPPLGIYNFHASILPKYRGPSPIETAIACGEKETGVSLMAMVEEMDAGAVADVAKIAVKNCDCYGDVSQNLAALCPILLEKNLGKMCSKTLDFVKQDGSSATFTKKLSKVDGLLDFAQPATALANRVRALTPHIGCHIAYGGVRLRIGAVSAEKTGVQTHKTHKCGQIVAADRDGVKIATGNGILSIHELQRPGRKMIGAAEFLNGFPVEPGAVIPSYQMQQLSFDRPHWLIASH
jgi:methionyl-tRNA formyltransferase